MWIIILEKNREFCLSAFLLISIYYHIFAKKFRIYTGGINIRPEKLSKSLFVSLLDVMSWSKNTITNSRRISDNFELPPTPPTPSCLHLEGQNPRSATDCEMTPWCHRWSWSNSCSGFDIATDEIARLHSSPYIANFLQSTDSNQNYRRYR